MPTLPADLRLAARTLRRSPGFSTLVIVVVALGIGANTAVFSVVNAVLLRPLPYESPSRLFQIDEIDPKGQPSGVSPYDLAVLLGRSHVFEQAAFSQWQNFTLTGPEGPENVWGGKVSPGCFAMLGARAALGRTFSPGDFRPGAAGTVILSDRLWRRRFAGNPGVVGRALMMSGEAYTIAGVMPRDFIFGQQRYDLWTAWRLTAEDEGRRDSRFAAVVRLRGGIAGPRAHAEAEAIYRDIAPAEARHGWRLRLVPLGSLALAPARPALLVLLGAAGFVLLIACLNVANLLLARASARECELAVRAALGAGRFRLVRELLTESVVLAGSGGVLGVALAAAGTRALLAAFPDRIPVPRFERANIDTTVLLFALALSLLTAFAFGLLPALRAARPELAATLRQGGRGSGGSARSFRLRDLLVAGETALSLVLLAGAGLMLRSLDRLLSVDPGFQPDRVLSARVPLPAGIAGAPHQAAYHERMLERLERLPRVSAAGLIAPLPLGEVDANSIFEIEGRPVAAGERQLVKIRSVSPGYFRAMGIALRRGRLFGEGDTAGAPGVVVINEALAHRFFPGEEPLGRRVTMSQTRRASSWLTIVGIVNDVKSARLSGEAQPEMYRDFRQFLFAQFAVSLVLHTTARDPLQIAGDMQREIRRLNPDQAVGDIRTMRQVMLHSVAQQRLMTLLLSLFAAIALLLAAAGVYGVLSCAVAGRAHEIAIRSALGASAGQVLICVMGRALLLVGGGIGCGLAGALALTRLIAAQLFRVQPADIGTLAAVSLLLLAVSALAAWLPARRSLRIAPLNALHAD